MLQEGFKVNFFRGRKSQVRQKVKNYGRRGTNKVGDKKDLQIIRKEKVIRNVSGGDKCQCCQPAVLNQAIKLHVQVTLGLIREIGGLWMEIVECEPSNGMAAGSGFDGESGKDTGETMASMAVKSLLCRRTIVD